MNATEQRLRQELAACYRLIAHFRMSDLIFTHISLRLPGPEHHFLINPYGLLFDEITASSLVKIDLQGRPVEPSPHPVNPAGFVIHSAIHAAREDAHCVLHTHTRAGCAVAALECGLLPVNQMSMEFYGRVAYHAYEGIALDMDEQQRLVADLGDKPVMILRNHGLLATGGSVAEAFLRMYYLEKACEIQLAAQIAGQVILPPAEVCAHTERQFNAPGRGLKQGELTDPDALQLAWAALLRMLERVAPGYQD
ncbi:MULTISPECIES: class II aldolase/adducin family protein [Pseudomonas]|uniref:Aldolase n=1 Tax=Pseudomonas putida NBRC 14164 TaxID=1211579 RepID=A0ABM7EG22_PSEPU|nr:MULTISPECIES: class II aldolase/adducin family protein [Pseudomonas]EKT4459774.1 class II aldolase/adducin family protein [Pseudomonas putida]EKT4554933.1 class II aldolase/adducin family protein [Pseudomonas putida]MCX9134944.1 class II aldolase/adducin family protein [Pseudomonas sp. DCB_PUT]MDD1971522.1 class II aldolase/adducin family protein [Pseudomonas putida]MDO1463449.1 class II aldolase/adducin family protein [Pseudomonas putida]